MAIRADKRSRTAVDLAENWPSLYRFPSMDGIIRSEDENFATHSLLRIAPRDLVAATDKWISRGWKISLRRPFIVVATEISPPF